MLDTSQSVIEVIDLPAPCTPFRLHYCGTDNNSLGVLCLEGVEACWSYRFHELETSCSGIVWYLYSQIDLGLVFC